MIFPDEVREKLLDKDFVEWTNEIQRMIPFYGQTMTKSATIAYEKELIEKRFYLILTVGGGGH
jgi:superfamily II DNA/RNA helicase